MSNISNWTHKGRVVDSMDYFPEDAIGFTYLIMNTSKDMFYIGRKALTQTRKKKFGKKKMSTITDKRVKTYEMITRESNWKSYTGSNKELNQCVKEGDVITREILDICTNKTQMTYFETKRLFEYEVLETDRSYNLNILGKFYRKSLGLDGKI